MAARPNSERVAGVVCLVAAAVLTLLARSFRVAFLTDPIGPRAMPWLAAALLGIGGFILVARPGNEPEWPQATMRRKIATVVAAFVAYAVLMTPLGFVLATTLLMAVLARVFEGRLLPGLVAGATFSAAMWLLFVLGLGVSLPIGFLFTRGG